MPTILGTSGSDTLNGLSGDNTMLGGDGSDKLNGGAGNDLLDGGAGADTLSGNSGNDILVYDVSRSGAGPTGAGSAGADVYDGGSGIDTLKLAMTYDQWVSSGLQTDLAKLLGFININTNVHTQEATNAVFTFQSTGWNLQVSKIENVQVVVDGLSLSADNNLVVAVNDTMTADENNGGTSSNLLANDSVLDLAKSVEVTSGPLTGTVVLTQSLTNPANQSVTATYTPTAGFYDYLAVGESATDSFTYRVTDANDDSATATVSVVIQGANDPVTITSGLQAGGVTEDGAQQAAGTINFTDPDFTDTHAVTVLSSPAHPLGTLTLDPVAEAPNTAGGSVNWTYTLDNAAAQYLGAGETVTETYTLKVADAHGSSDTQTVTITIHGTNDVPVIGGAATGAVTEDTAVSAGKLATGGALTIADVDQGQSSFTAQASAAATYGTFTLAADGQWTYSADNSQTAIQQLGAGDSLTDSFTAVSSDGSASRVVTVTITGVNDTASITGDTTGALTEDAAPTATGTLTVADVDDGQAHAQPVTTATATVSGLGTYTVDADGHWSYTVDESQIQHLAARATTTDSFLVSSQDGSASQTVTVTITGVNDVPVIGGASSGAVTEDTAVSAGKLATGGALTIADVDQGQSSFKAQASAAATYGTFTLAADGQWTYSADNSQTAIQQLGAGDSLTDSFTAASSDGSASQVVTVTIHGTNDVPVIGGAATGDVTEDVSVVSGKIATSGALTIADVDQGQSNFTAQASAAATYGTFTLAADGHWTYAADNSQTAIQQLNTGDSLTDSFTAVSSDGTASQVVTVTIHGTSDTVTFPTASSDSNDPNNYDNDTTTATPTSSSATSGNDVLVGGTGSENINGNLGNDTILGGDGNDAIHGNNGADVLYGQAGADTLSGDNNFDTLYGGSGNDSLDGGGGDDIVYGGSGADTLANATTSNDQMFGGSGNDKIVGGAGNETIVGGFGADTLTGGGGNDKFVFLDARDTNDVITDFGSGDVIDLSGIDGDSTVGGLQSFSSTLNHSTSLTAHSVSWYFDGTNTIIIADTDGNTSNAEFMITLSGNHDLSAMPPGTIIL